jgi:RNA polymerase sigma-70 factor (ECF subfamily)
VHVRASTDLDDEKLWQRTQNGDADAFEILFDRYCDLIYNFVYRRTASWDAADEAVAVVFAEAWRQRNAVRLHEGSLRPWLLGVATNMLRRRWRSADRAARALGRVHQLQHVEDHADAVIDRLDNERRLHEAIANLASLAEDQREVLLLWAWEHLTYDEMSVALSIPVGTVRSRLSRARLALAERAGTAHAHRASHDDAPRRTAAECFSEGD